MITARTAILQALRQGPGYGRQLMRRVKEATGGRASLAPGSVYPALRALEQSGFVRKWMVVVGRVRGGRARSYYELTVAGIRQAEAEGVALAGIALAGRPVPQGTPASRAAARARLERVGTLFEFATETRDAVFRTRRHA